MKLVIPMAGRGSRMRPHTWTCPKPLLPLAGQPMLAHVLDVFSELPIEEFVFIVGWLGDQVREFVMENYAIPAHFVEQTELLGQAHALWLAREHMQGPLFTFFVDTLFFGADFSNLDAPGLDGVIYTKEVADPRRFGAVKVGPDGWATRLIEKPSSLDKLSRTTSPSSKVTGRLPISSSLACNTRAMVDFPAPESPVQKMVNPCR